MVNVHNPHHLSPQSKDTHRGQGKQRSACLYFALPSEQAVNLCSAPAYLGACRPRPCPGRKASHASALSPPPPSPRLPLCSVLLGWVKEVAADWIILPFTISPKFAFICRALPLLFCCVCFLSGSRSESVSTCCFISYQLWHWPAIVMQRRNRAFIGVWAHFPNPEPPWWHCDYFHYQLIYILLLLLYIFLQLVNKSFSW